MHAVVSSFDGTAYSLNEQTLSIAPFIWVRHFCHDPRQIPGYMPRAYEIAECRGCQK